MVDYAVCRPALPRLGLRNFIGEFQRHRTQQECLLAKRQVTWLTGKYRPKGSTLTCRVINVKVETQVDVQMEIAHNPYRLFKKHKKSSLIFIEETYRGERCTPSSPPGGLNAEERRAGAGWPLPAKVGWGRVEGFSVISAISAR